MRPEAPRPSKQESKRERMLKGGPSARTPVVPRGMGEGRMGRMAVNWSEGRAGRLPTYSGRPAPTSAGPSTGKYHSGAYRAQRFQLEATEFLMDSYLCKVKEHIKRIKDSGALQAYCRFQWAAKTLSR